MGKRAGKYKPSRHGQKKIKNEWTSPIIPQDNPLFKAYYQLQLQLSAQQFQVFWASMKQQLPVVFRINPSCPNFSAFRDKVQDPHFLDNMIDKQTENEEGKNQPKQMPKIEILPWYPGNILHQINTTKQIFKKSKVLNNLHQYLQKGFDAGLIARQELVSMLPPLFLDVQHNDIILDMCAAPGSKTSQILQMLYGEQKSLAKGCVIANDADYSRAQMLIHQINRSGTAGMAVINHPGQFLPQLYTDKVNHKKQKFYFDKVLCDVPCSGDGATRKIPIKWAKWHTSDGISLHPLQLAILMKSINLLKRGGLIVYSTCSLNPIQNEAVLNGLLRKVGKGLEIVDIHTMYGVKGRRGMHDWKVCGVEHIVTKIEVQGKQKQQKIKKIKIYSNYEEAKDNHRIKESMFPPCKEQAQKMQLHHSMRILPHDQNSGGFFIALLKTHEDFEWKYDHTKKDNLVDEKDEENQNEKQDQAFVDNNIPELEQYFANEDCEKQQNQDDDVQNEDQENIEEDKQNKNKQPKQEWKEQERKQKASKYQKFDNMSEGEWQDVQKYFGLDPILKNLLYVRELEGNSRKRVLLISEGVRSFLEADRENKIKLVNMGCKVLQKGRQSFAGLQCLYRLSQEGIHFLLGHMTSRKVRVNAQFFRYVLSINSIVHDEIKQVQIREQIKSMSQGSFCIYIDQMIGGKHVVDAMVGQNFKSSFHLMVGKEELASLNLRYL